MKPKGQDIETRTYRFQRVDVDKNDERTPEGELDTSESYSQPSSQAVNPPCVTEAREAGPEKLRSLRVQRIEGRTKD